MLPLLSLLFQDALARSLLEAAASVAVWLVNDEAKYLALLHVVKPYHSNKIIAVVRTASIYFSHDFCNRASFE